MMRFGRMFGGGHTPRISLPPAGNLLSDPLFASGWSTSQATGTAAGGKGPNGQLDAALLTESDADSGHAYFQVVDNAEELTYRATCCFKRGPSGSRNAGFYAFENNSFDSGANVTFNLATGEATAADYGTYTAGTATVRQLTNGWWLGTFEFTTNADDDISFQVAMYNGTDDSYDGDATSNVLVWGADLRVV